MVGSLVGLAAGAGIAKLLQVAFAGAGLEISTGGLVFAPRTVVVSLVVGIVVTLLAAYVPARRASRVAPVAAMRDDVALAPRSIRRRGLLGAVLTALGLALLGASLAAGGPGAASQLVGLGALITLLGIIALSPAFSRPVVGLLGRPVRRVKGAVGRLSVANAERNPRRTSATASALMIGLALVSAFSVLAASTNASIDQTVDAAFGGTDFIVTEPTRAPFSPDVAAAVGAVDGVETVLRLRFGPAELAGEGTFLTAVDDEGLGDVLQLVWVEGGPDGLADGLIVDAATWPC